MRLRQLSSTRRFYGVRTRSRAMVGDRERSRSAERIERDIETLAGPDYTLSSEAIRRYAYTRRLPQHARLLHAGARGARLRGLPGSGRDARRAQPAARRAGFRHRLALRLEPERRPLRRHDGRRHRPRGLPAERGARARPAAPADLVPRGGGLRLRPDAARQPDHGAARDRGGAARRRSARSTTAAASGSTRRRPGTNPSAGASRSTCSTASPAGSRCTSSRRGCFRTPSSESGSSRRSPATSTPTSSFTGAPTMRARRRWTFASTPASCSPSACSSSSGSRAQPAGAPSAPSAKSRSHPL